MKHLKLAILIAAALSLPAELLSAGRETPQITDQIHPVVEKWFAAIQNGDLSTVKDLIGKIDINVQEIRGPIIVRPGMVQDHRGYTGLHKAVYYGHEHIVKLLLSVPGINVNIQDYWGNTPLIISSRGRANIVQLLLKVPGIDINAQNCLRENALYEAIWYGLEDIAKLLIDAGIDVNAKAEGATVLHLAASRNTAMVKLLLQVPGINCNATDERSQTPLIVALTERQFDSIDLFLAVPGINLIDKDRYEYTPYMTAKVYCPGMAPVIKKMIYQLAQSGFEAIKSQNIEILKGVLSSIGVNNISLDGETYLHVACRYNAEAIILLLLQMAKDPRELLCTKNNSGQFPLDLLNPTSAIFGLLLDIAYIPPAIAVKQEIELPELPALTAVQESQKSGKTKWAISRFFKSRLSRSKKTVSNLCAVCSKPNCTQYCSNCKKVYYCSLACQKADWKTHKTCCKKA